MKESRGVPDTIPIRHVAIIMDGNGRWARLRHLPRLAGHEAGVESVRAALRACREASIQYLTLYTLSVENWRRPREEIDGLMNLLERFLREREKELHEHQVRLRHMGRIEDLPAGVRAQLTRVEETTHGYTQGQLILALSYGGRTEMTRAARMLAERVRTGELLPEEIDERAVANHLYLPDVPDPDLLIRTGGEMRVSNFLLWQIAYTELYVTPVLWPDFREKDFQEALVAYRQRERRFGGLGSKTP